MKQAYRSIWLNLGSWLATGFILAGCVTTSNTRFSENADEKQALLKYTELGLRYIDQGKTVEAKRPLKRAFEIDPKSPDVHIALAILFQAENEPEKAEDHFIKALQYGPNETRIRNNYAAFLYSQQRFADASVQLEAAANDSLYENRASVYENLGMCYLKMDQKTKALVAFDRAVDIDDSRARALIEAARMHFANGGINTSQRYHTQYQRLVRLRHAPNSPRSLALGVELARVSGDKNREASYLLMLKNMFPESGEYQRIKHAAD